ncbi:hypothetical protein Bca4012_057663 [Brassica carinata]|uniref:Uncharacterized protein n=1 Tax=Brassica carinata TaxID=52824 RepID=A0A8X7W140_BRACI|nr:hypothetical protein Bca52824_014962 [Brassica carinata]
MSYSPRLCVIMSANSYIVSLPLPPVVSFLDCIVRTRACMEQKVCKEVQPAVRQGNNKHGKDEFDRMKGTAIAETVTLHVPLGRDSDDSSRVMFCEEKGFNMDLFRVQRTNLANVALAKRFKEFVLKWSPFMREFWDNNMGIPADMIAGKAVHHYIYLKILTEVPFGSMEVPRMTNAMIPDLIANFSICYGISNE